MINENYYEIRNCVFAFKCSANWDNLEDTNKEKIRYCSDCSKEVHFCEDDKELSKAVRNNYCVAFEKINEPGRKSFILTGFIRPNINN